MYIYNLIKNLHVFRNIYILFSTKYNYYKMKTMAI